MENQNSRKSNKKSSLLWTLLPVGAVGTILAISLPFALRKNETATSNDESQLVQTSAINVSDQQVEIKISNLRKYIGQWLLIEYKPQNSTALFGTDTAFSKSFLVSSISETVSVGELIASLPYDYVIKTFEGVEVSKGSVFSTYSKPNMDFTAQKKSISFVSSSLGDKFAGKIVVVRYQVWDANNKPTGTINELEAEVKAKQYQGKTIYVISGTIPNLTQATSYGISLAVKGETGIVGTNYVASTSGYDQLTALPVSGNNFTDSLKFNLAGVSPKFPIGQPMKVQWRVKPADAKTAWSLPRSEDSYDFSIASLPADENYSVEVPNNNLVNTWYAGVTYEWRVVKNSLATQNIIELGTAEFSLAETLVTSKLTDKISPSLSSSLKWRAPLIDNIVGSGMGDNYSTSLWRPMFGLKSKAEMRDFLEWLAFQDEATKDKFIANFILAVKKNTASSGQRVELTGKWTIVPYFPSNYGGDATNGAANTFPDKGTGNNGKIGGYKGDEYPEDTPIKPSDFMTNSNKFIGYEKLPEAIKYYLNGIKDGWEHSSVNKGVSRDNTFINGQALSKSESYASYFVNKEKLDGNMVFSGVTDLESDGWTLETLANTGTETNLWANDLKGELYVKIKATKESKVHYYWHKISGFKKATESAPAEADLQFELYEDHSRNARLIDAELKKATTLADKKKVIEKYWKAKYESVYPEGWEFVSATPGSEGNILTLKAKLPKKVVAKGTMENKLDKGEVESTSEFTYILPGYHMASLKSDSLYDTKWIAKGTIATSATDAGSDLHFVNILWTYEQMIAKMQDAVLEGTSAVDTLAEDIISGAQLSSWTETSQKLYLRTMDSEPILASGSRGDYNSTSESRQVNNPKYKGFLSTEALTTADEDTRKTKVVAMINKYGAMS